MPRMKRSSDPIAVHIGSRLFRLRKKHGLTIRDVADETGLTNPFICMIENGKCVPSARSLFLLSKAFGVSFGSWMSGYQESGR